MRYVCLVFTDEERLAGLSASAIAQLNAEWRACEATLRANGVLLSGGDLLPAGSATTVRVRDNAVRLSDGSPIRTREQLSWYGVIDARDLNDAVRIAAKLPPARHGIIEVRPVRHVEPRSATATPTGKVS